MVSKVRSLRTVMYFSWCVFAVVLVSFFPDNSYSQRVIADRPIMTKAPESINMMLEPYCAKYGIPALGAAVVKGGRIIAIGAVGTRKAGEKIAVTPSDRFHIGSDSKAMTALLVAMYVEQGKLRWDSRLEEIFPELAKTMGQGMGAITLEQLLSHSSGMPADSEPLSDKLIAESFTRSDDNLTDTRYWLLSRWITQPVAVPPKTRFLYSNMGYVMVGAVLDKVSGKSWEELIVEKIFVPLKLRNAGFGPQSSIGRIDAPLPHKIMEGGKVKPMMAGPNADNPLFMGSAGTIHMSLQDFARWAAWSAGQGKRGPALVKPGTISKLMTPVMDITEDGKPGTPLTGRYALGWGMVKRPYADEYLVTHSGSNEMNLAHIVLDPAKDFGIVIMANIAGKETMKAFSIVGEELYKKYGNK